MKKFNEQAFLIDMASICWDQIVSPCTEIDLLHSLNIDLKWNYITESIQNSEGNTNEAWKATNQLMNKRSKTINIDQLKKKGM